jgi:hypothetical protein
LVFQIHGRKHIEKLKKNTISKKKVTYLRYYAEKRPLSIKVTHLFTEI